MPAPSRKRDRSRVASRAEPAAGISVRVSRSELQLIVAALYNCPSHQADELTALADRLAATTTMIPARLSPAQIRVMKTVHARRVKSPEGGRELRPYKALEERGLIECRKGVWYLTDLGREAVRVGWDFAGHANVEERKIAMSS